MPKSVSVFVAACITCLGFANDGKALTQASLVLPNAPVLAQASPPATSPLPLQLGNRGLEVAQLQKSLQTLGYYPGAVDGVYGQGTQEAVAKFQTAIGLTANGTADSNTRSRLQQQLSAQATPTETPKPPKKPQRNQRNRIVWIVLVGLVAIGIGTGVYFLLRLLMRPLPDDDEEEMTLQEGTEEAPEAPSQGWEGATTSNGRGQPTEVLIISSNGNSEPVRPEPIRVEDSDPEPEHPDPNHLQPNSGTVPPPPDPQTIPQDTVVKETPVSETTRLPRMDIIEAFIQDLQSADPAIRRKAIWELAQRGDSRAMQPLLDLMIDSDSRQRGLILEALSQIGNRTLKPLNRALALSLQDESSEVRKNAVRDLTKVYDLMSHTQQILRHAADDPDQEVQATVKWAMGQLKRLQKTIEPDNRQALPKSPDAED